MRPSASPPRFQPGVGGLWKSGRGLNFPAPMKFCSRNLSIWRSPVRLSVRRRSHATHNRWKTRISTAPISKTRIWRGRILSGLLVVFFNRKSQTGERLHHTGGARHRYGKHVGICEKQSRDRQEALPRTRELAALVLSLPPGRGSATFLKRLHIYVAHPWRDRAWQF